MSSSSASASQQEKITTLRAIADLPTDDDAAALLARASWDLPAAVDAFLSGTVLPSPSPPPAPAAPRPPVAANANAGAVALPRAPFAPWLAIIFAPLRAAWSVVTRLAGAFYRVFGGNARAIAAAPGATDTARFAAWFDGRYSEGRRPVWFEGRYAEALARAQRELKFLVVYVHSEGHGSSAEFVRRVVRNAAVAEMIDGRFVAWGGSVCQTDAAAVGHALRVDGYPFLGVVAAPRSTVRPPREGEVVALTSGNYGVLLARISGNVLRNVPATASGDEAGERVVAWLASVLESHDRRLEVVRRERADRETERELRREQDQEYAATLEADRALEKEKARKKEEGERAEREAEAEESAEREKVAAVETRRARKREGLAAEPEKAPGVATVVLRLPEGGRASRRFAKDEALEVVFDWAEGHCGVDVEVACLVQSYPRKKYRYPEEAGMTLAEAGFFPSAMLLLEERSDE